MAPREATLKGLLSGDLPMEHVGQRLREAARRAVMSGDPDRMARAAGLVVDSADDDQWAHDSMAGDGLCQDQNMRCTLRAAIEEAKKRDHRRVGVDLDLYFLDAVAPGSPSATVITRSGSFGWPSDASIRMSAQSGVMHDLSGMPSTTTMHCEHWPLAQKMPWGAPSRGWCPKVCTPAANRADEMTSPGRACRASPVGP